jgi:hypothetical protein
MDTMVRLQFFHRDHAIAIFVLKPAARARHHLN